MKLLYKLLRDETGATMIEYALIASLISVIAIGSMTSIGQSVLASLQDVATNL